MDQPHCPNPTRPSLNYHLYQSKCDDDLRHLIVDISVACKYISYALQTTEAGLTGSVNQFGEDQQKLDVLSDDILRQKLSENAAVNGYVSEEQEEAIILADDKKYTVAFDPLDGSSLVEANLSIGTIVGIYEGTDIVGQKPRDQVAALYVLYGPRTLLVYSTGKGTHCFILNDVGEFILLEAHMGIADDAKNYSPGNLRAINSNPGYKQALNHWLDDSLTLRYSGCMVADIHHILSKGQGVFSNVGGETYPEGKLRHAIEVGPFAFLVDQAGGTALDGELNLLDKKITAIDQRTPVVIGSKNEVEKTVHILLGSQSQ